MVSGSSGTTGLNAGLVFTTEYSAGIMEMWARWDTYHELYTLDEAKDYLASRTHLHCDNELGFLSDAIWLAGKMVGWAGYDGVIPSDEEMEERKEENADHASRVLEGYEKRLLKIEYATVLAEYGG